MLLALVSKLNLEYVITRVQAIQESFKTEWYVLSSSLTDKANNWVKAYTCILYRKTLGTLLVPSKAKAVPSQAWSSQEVSRKLRFPDYLTTVQNGGKVVSLTHRPPLPTENAPGTHFC
jgi:hypothetical protein